MSEYDMTIHHNKSEENILADFLSTNPTQQSSDSHWNWIPTLSTSAEKLDVELAISPLLELGGGNAVIEVLPETPCDEVLVTLELLPQ